MLDGDKNTSGNYTCGMVREAPDQAVHLHRSPKLMDAAVRFRRHISSARQENTRISTTKGHFGKAWYHTLR